LDSVGGTLSFRRCGFTTHSVSLLVMVLLSPAWAQTYKVNSASPERPESDTNQAAQQKSLGWGSNIQNARLARAAELALKEGKYSAAVDYAQRATESAPNDPQLWFLLGYAARLARKTQLSLDAYNHGLAISPSSLDGLSGLAQTYSIMGRKDEAERLLNQVLSVDPKRVGDAELLGELLLQSGQYDRAVDVLGRVEQSSPNARVEVLLALSYEHQKQFDQANRYLELARRRAPGNPEVQRSLAGFYRKTGNYPAAIAALKAIPHRAPEVTAELAYTYQLLGKPDESARLYAEAADAVPWDLNLQLSAAQAEVTAGALEHAQRFVQRATALDPEHYRLHAVRGEIARLEERDQDAIQEYAAALSNLPQSPPEGSLYSIQLHMDLVELYRHQEKEAEASRHLQIAQSQINALDERGPDRPQFLRLRATIKMNAGDLNGAEQDIQEALALNGKDINALQLEGDLLTKSGHPEDAIAAYKKVLPIEPANRFALTSLGYVSREAGHDQEAEKYFQKLAATYPNLYVPYLALGDMYAARRDFAKAEAAYRKGHGIAPTNSLMVAGAMNAAIEDHQFSLAGDWLKRANPEMQQNPYVMREKERYLSFIGEYQQSAEVGQEAIKKLPKDRDVVVYLGYDLLHLERYDELSQLSKQYEDVLPKEADIPLFAGYVHKHAGQLEDAEKDFTAVLDRDSKVATAYVNRGFVRNDLHQPKPAAADFESALKLEPKNGEAHLGLAYANLNLHRPRIALRQVKLAEEQMGESMQIHLIRATAYGDEGSLVRAVAEYRAALKYSPNDPALHIALANTLYGLHQYREAISELQLAENLSPNNSLIYAQLARSYAQLHDRDNTLLNVGLAEQHAQQAKPEEQSEILVSNGEALSLLGDHDAAMQRFERALTAPDSDRVSVRLAIARLMVGERQEDDARRQIALGLMEARAGETLPPTGEQYMQAADVLLGIHDFQLAETYFQRARAAGASDTGVRVGLANAYLATGDTIRARGEISNVASIDDSEPSYQYLLAKAALLRQQHQNTQALTAFAQAANAAGEDQTADQELLQMGANEGLRINRHVSFLSDFSVQPIFEDTTVYPLDAKLDVSKPLPGRQGLLPLPRSSLETQWTGAYHLHLGNLPDASGFFQVRNARGQISLPSADSIINRDTTDYSFNFGLNPVLHLGNNVFTFSTGIQETIRRDSESPVQMDQNLFRQFLYMNTSSFFNFLSVSGYAIREAGPFTLSNLHSRDLTGALDFRVGRPWGKTALVTGWGATDDQFTPAIIEFYYTSAYVGIEHKISDRLSFRAIAEDLRAWRVEGARSAISQALRPAGSIQFSPTRNWSVQANFAYSSNMGFHAYDAVQSGFSVSYAMPIQRMFKEPSDEVVLRYPIRFSAGMQQQSFFNFNGGNNQMFRPFVSITLF